MPELSAEQALFGYRDGHDLLASSVDLDGETLRLLRSATDVSIDGLSGRYLSTVIPLPKMRSHAFVRSWSGGQNLRPGSVFAHVILLDVVALGRLTSFEGIRKAFSRPSEADPRYSGYRRPLVIDTHDESDSPSPHRLGLEILSRVYGSNGLVHAAEPDLESAETVLYGLLAQQWPKLRRDFAFRTRVRPTETAWRVDVEVTARGNDVEVLTEHWALKLARDLDEPDMSFRRFLWRYGAESKRGRADMPLLVDLFEAVRIGDFDQASSLLVAQYPRPAEMRVLKREVFRDTAALGLRDEANALGAVVRHAASFDLEALHVGARLAHTANVDPRTTESILTRLDLPSLTDSVVAELAESISRNATPEVLASIAAANPELAVLIVGLRPVLLGVREVWLASDMGLLTDVFFAAPKNEQREVLVRLVRDGSLEPLVAICSRQPAIWWDLLAEVAQRPTRDQVESSRVIGEVLVRIGTSSVATPTATLSDADLGVLLQASNLGNGLWRRVDASRWIELVSGLKGLKWPAYLRDRSASVALMAGNSSLSADTRSRAWKATFGILHERLKDSNFDQQAWALLSATLPTAPAWDRCLRLRRGVVSEVRRDRWSVGASESLIRESRGFESEMRSEIEHIHNPHRSWLEQILARLTGTD